MAAQNHKKPSYIVTTIWNQHYLKMESDSSSSQGDILGDTSEEEVQQLSEEEAEEHPIVAEMLYTTALGAPSPSHSPVSTHSDDCMLSVQTHHLGAIPKNYMNDPAFQRKDKIARSPGGKRAEEPSAGEIREGAEKVGEEAEGEIGQGAEGEVGKGGAKGRKEGNEKVLVEDIESEGDEEEMRVAQDTAQQLLAKL